MPPSSNEYDLVQRALAAGAESYLLKNIGAADLAAAIRVAHTGSPARAIDCFEDMARAAGLFELPAPADGGADLTCREHDVLALMAQGLTNIQIGAQLDIRRATAKAHVSSILSKLGAASRTEAVALAIEHHLTNGPA